MTDMYNKLFTKILDSSIWMESKDTRLVFLTFLAAMDEDGFVRMASVANVAHRARVEPEFAAEAVRILESPDPHSSDPDNDGRRIERVDGGWIVMNSQKYRALVTKAIIQEQTRERVKRFREKKRGGNAKVTREKRSETPSESRSKAISEAEHLPLVPGTSTALSVEESAKVDRLDDEIAFEERRFSELALPIRDSIQTVLDSLPRPASRAPFSASRWTRTGLTGIGRSESALTVLRLTNDALEAHQRAQERPNISDSNRETLENLKRAGDRIRARQAQQPKPREITG